MALALSCLTGAMLAVSGRVVVALSSGPHLAGAMLAVPWWR